MRIFHSINIEERFPNPVLTIGNYDGIHTGHLTIIERVRTRAREIGGTSMLMTFHPHPLHILRPERELSAITPLDEKKRLITETGIDVLFVIPFTKEFSSIDPETFVKHVLVEQLGIKGLIIGYDFRFGREGKGDTQLLQELGKRHGFFVEVVGAVTVDDEKVGSNRIRKLVAHGEVGRAAKLLGRPYSIAGKVVRARGRGRTIGYPTINLQTGYSLIPRTGVYVTEVAINDTRHPGVTNVGYNPTFGDQERSIETYIIDFSGELYDKEVTVRFLGRIRDEQKFNTVDELKAQIAKDVSTAREYFRSRRPLTFDAG